jgi:hypothetical protein
MANPPRDATANDLGGILPVFEACAALRVCHILSSIAGQFSDFCNMCGGNKQRVCNETMGRNTEEVL